MKTSKRALINKLAAGRLSSDPLRAAFTVLSASIMIVVIATTLNIAVSMIKTSEQGMRDAAGTMADYQLKNPTESQMGLLRKSAGFDAVGIAVAAGFAEIGQTFLALTYVDEEEWNKNRKPTVDIITGRNPIKESDIMLSRHTLQKMGVEDPIVGQEIHMTLQNSGEGGQQERVFHLSGWFQSYSRYMEIQNIGYVSAAFINETGLTGHKDETVYFQVRRNPALSDLKMFLGIFKLLAGEEMAALREQQWIESIAETIDLQKGQQIEKVYTPPENKFDVLSASPIYILIALCTIISAAFLLFDCFYLAVENEIEQRRLLRGIGMTDVQSRAVSNRYTLWVFTASALIGGVVSAAFAVYLVPLYIQTSAVGDIRVSYNWSTTAMLFGLCVTLLIIITGSRYAENTVDNANVEKGLLSKPRLVSKLKARNAISKAFSRKKQYPISMALSNTFQTTKKNKHVFFSLITAATIFITISIIVTGIDPESFADKRFKGYDFRLVNWTFSAEYSHYAQINFGQTFEIGSKVFPDSFVEEMRTKEGVTAMIIEKRLPAMIRTDLEVMGDFINHHFEVHNWFREYTDGHFESSAIMSVNDMQYLYERISDEQKKQIDFAAFERGESALFESDRPDLFLAEFKIEGFVGSGYNERGTFFMPPGSEPFSYMIGGFINPPSLFLGDTLLRSSLPPVIYVHETAIRNFRTEAAISEIIIDVDIDKAVQMEVWLQSQIKNNELIVLESRLQYLNHMKARENAAYAIGYTLVFLTGLTAFFSFLNMISINISQRKTEIITLWSIGMSQRQIRRMLMLEGVFYATLVAVFTVIICNFGVFQIYKAYKWDYELFNYPLTELLGVCGCLYLLAGIVPQAICVKFFRRQ